MSAHTFETAVAEYFASWGDGAEMAGSLRAALAAAGLAVEQDWQPIETAPKTGKVWVQTYEKGASTREINIDYYLPGEGWNGAPTHWRPLPAPPAAQEPAR